MPKHFVHENVSEKLKNLPAKPGCYMYRGENSEVLYVGKAKVLKNRVRSYFQPSAKHSNRIARLVNKTRDVEWIVVDSELEALVLECNLIKQHRPPYNVRLRDDKSYPYITITKENFPRVLFTRKVRKDGAKYFGPYTSAYSVRETVALLHKVYPLIPCGKSWSGKNEQRPCLYHHLKQCLAPCAGIADRNEYAKVIGEVNQFLSGREETLVEGIEKEMLEASNNLEFERAAVLRDRLQSLRMINERQKVLTTDQVDRDIVAVVKDERGAAIQMLYVRAGKLIGQRQFILDGTADASPGEAVQEFVKQYYSESTEVPREVLLPVEIEEHLIVQQWLRQRRGAATTIEVPQGGEKLRLVEMAAENAQLALESYRTEITAKDEWADQAGAQLAEALGLAIVPRRVEGYDISNIQGTAPVGSMVVVEDGVAANAEYRRFRIKFQPETPNDFAMMNEVLLRRLRHYVDGDPKFSRLADLIMIDGGKGQLGAALKARDLLGLTVPMIGLAKKMELVVVPHIESSKVVVDAEGVERMEHEYGYSMIELPMTSPGLMLLRRLRDEAHRFALTYHRKVRDKRMTGSILEEIPGVGPRRRRLLLRSFGSVEGIRRATKEELAAIPTMTMQVAERIREYLSADSD